jgi:hypothetical protein
MSRTTSHAAHDTKFERVVVLTVAALVAVGGYVHFCLYDHGYRAIPTIGTTFLLQALSSVVIAAGLVLPWHVVRVGARRYDVATAMKASAALLSVGTLVGFWLSRRRGGIFHFQETGLQPAPQALVALVAESTVLVLTVGLLAADLHRSRVSANPGVTRARIHPHE